MGCDLVFECVGGVWANPDYESTFGCNPDVPNPSSCPADYSDLQAAEAGTCSVANLLCAYPEGVCQCLTTYTCLGWYCPGSGCPAPRARLGAACSTPGQDCPYYPCLWDEISQRRVLAGAERGVRGALRDEPRAGGSRPFTFAARGKPFRAIELHVANAELMVGPGTRPVRLGA